MSDMISVPRDLLRALADIASENGYPCAGDVYDLLSGETKCGEGEIRVTPRTKGMIVLKSDTRIEPIGEACKDTEWVIEAVRYALDEQQRKFRLGNGWGTSFTHPTNHHKVITVSFEKKDHTKGEEDIVVFGIGAMKARLTSSYLKSIPASIHALNILEQLKGYKDENSTN